MAGRMKQVDPIAEMQAFARFGRAILDLAKESGVVPKRQARRVVYKTKIVVRKPRGPNKAKVEATTAAPAAEQA